MVKTYCNFSNECDVYVYEMYETFNVYFNEHATNIIKTFVELGEIDEEMLLKWGLQSLLIEPTFKFMYFDIFDLWFMLLRFKSLDMLIPNDVILEVETVLRNNGQIN